jgi:hypothetical protein
MDSEKRKLNGWEVALVVLVTVWVAPLVIMWELTKSVWESIVESWRS